METLLQDLRYGLRMLAKKPGFTLVAVITLALGIGANTSIFSVVNAFLLRPLPYPDPDRLVMIYDTQPSLDLAPASYLEFQDYRSQGEVFEEVTAIFHSGVNYIGKSEPERLRGAMVSENYFSLLGAQPALGRSFSPEDHQAGASPVVLVSHSFWQRHFNSDPGLIGQSLLLNGTGYTVIGVMPADAPDFSRSAKTDVWVPLEPNPPWKTRGSHYLTVMARLKLGITFERAQSDMQVVASRLDEQYKNGHGIKLVTFRENLAGDTRASLLVLLGAVAFLLLIACANVANLLLARATARVKEFAVRTALGASRARLIRQMITESVTLAVIGGALGVLLAVWATDALTASWPDHVLRPQEMGIDWRVFSFTLAVSLAVGILFGLAPALHASRTNLNESLKESSGKSSAGAGRRGLRSLLVVSEIALAMVLLVGAGLMLKSFWLLQQVNPGFNPENVLTMGISLPATKYKEPWKQSDFFRQVLERVSNLPGVEAAGAVNDVPLSGGGMNGSFAIERRPPFPADQEPLTDKNIVSPDYFRAMAIPLLRGRFFTEQDTKDRPKVAIINEAMARRFWPDEDPIGKRLDIHFGESGDWQEIIGIVGDVKSESLDRSSPFQSYISFLQYPIRGMTVVARTTSDPTAIASAARSQVFAIDREQPVNNVRTMEEYISRSVAGARLLASLLGGFAALAALLAAIGIYGVISYSVTQRSHEIGIRMALGAQQRDVLRLVMGDGLILTAIGVGVGLGGALALTRLMSSLLFGVSATDPVTFAGVPVLLAAVALLACYLPARRATKVDPMIALRYE